MRTRIEKAIALIRQGHSARAIEILENVCGELPYEQQHEDQPETLELEDITKVAAQIPSFTVYGDYADDIGELEIDDEGWEFDADWKRHLIFKAGNKFEHNHDSEEVTDLVREMLTEAVKQGKVWRR